MGPTDKTAMDTGMKATGKFNDGTSWSGEVFKDQVWVEGPLAPMGIVSVNS
jgi:hypothetical protein